MRKPSLRKKKIFYLDRFKSFFAERIPFRVHMTLILVTTMASGVVFSKSLLFFELQSIALRYSLSVLFSYCVFFLLLRLWIQFHFEDENESEISSKFQGDVPESSIRALVDSMNLPLPSEASKSWTGDGGQFSGGGASGSWDEADSGLKTSAPAKSTSSSLSIGDADELGAILLFAVLIVSICFSSVYIIFYAPEIMLEAAFEVVLASMITRKIKSADSNDWMKSLFKKTWIPFSIILIIACFFGTYLKTNCPKAISFRQFLNECSDR